MKRFNKKLISAVLSASLTVTSVPFAGAGSVAEEISVKINTDDTAGLVSVPSAKTADAAAELPTFSVKKEENGNLTITAYNGTAADVVIPDKIDGAAVTAVGSGAFMSKAITSVKIPSSITTIGYRAFRDCDLLGEVTIPDTVTVIEAEAFYNCNKLVTVNMSKGIKTVGNSAFAENPSLLGIEIPAGAESLGASCFQNCDALSRVILPDGITLGNSCFSYCDGLEYLSLPDNVTFGEKAFAY